MSKITIRTDKLSVYSKNVGLKDATVRTRLKKGQWRTLPDIVSYRQTNTMYYITYKKTIEDVSQSTRLSKLLTSSDQEIEQYLRSTTPKTFVKDIKEVIHTSFDGTAIETVIDTLKHFL